MNALKKAYGEIEKSYVMFCETADLFKKHLSSKDNKKIEETDDKIELITQHFEQIKIYLTEVENRRKKQQIQRAKDLIRTSSKNAKSSISGSVGKLFDYKRLSPEKRILVEQNR